MHVPEELRLGAAGVRVRVRLRLRGRWRSGLGGMHLRNWDLAVPGSPSSKQLMSPRMRCLPCTSFCTPPNIESAMAVLMSSWPKMEGAMERMTCRIREVG